MSLTISFSIESSKLSEKPNALVDTFPCYLNRKNPYFRDMFRFFFLITYFRIIDTTLHKLVYHMFYVHNIT